MTLLEIGYFSNEIKEGYRNNKKNVNEIALKYENEYYSQDFLYSLGLQIIDSMKIDDVKNKLITRA